MSKKVRRNIHCTLFGALTTPDTDHFRSNAGPPIEEITNELKLRFYGLFKQASTGPCNESQPSRLKVVQRMKWYV